MPLECQHQLKHNKELDYIFCSECGKKWELPQEKTVDNWNIPNDFSKPYIKNDDDNICLVSEFFKNNPDGGACMIYCPCPKCSPRF